MDNQPIRVLHVVTTMNLGGIETFLMTLYRNIDRTKVQFDFLVHRKEPGVFDEEIKSLGGRIYEMPVINPLKLKEYNKQLSSFLKTNPYKIIHSHINSFSFYPLKIANELNIPIRIAHAHTTTPKLTFKLAISNPKEFVKIIFKNHQRRKLKKEANFLFACGRKAGDWLFSSENYRIIPNAIDIERFKYSKGIRGVLRKKFSLEEHLVIGHIGNFTYPKNYPFLLKVFKTLKNYEPKSKLVLIGGGNLEFEVKKMVESMNLLEDVIFLGKRKDVADLIQMMDVFLFPSHYEGLPLTLIEAQASGLKIFASETITSEVNITNLIEFLSIDNPQIWVDHILNNLDYKRENMSERIRDAGYDVQHNAKQLQDFYLNLMS